MTGMIQDPNDYSYAYGPRPGAFVNIIGIGISLLVLGGIVLWGANILNRDATGVPVVEAIDGPMRVVPDEPGGLSVPHQGLAVNEVTSSQQQSTVTDDLRLAPAPASLTTDKDPAPQTTNVAPQQRPRINAKCRSIGCGGGPCHPTR